MTKKNMDILDYKEHITKIYLVRHGETKANKLRLLFGHLDWDLTRDGIKQAKGAALLLSKFFKERFDYLITSPLQRARHTASIITKRLRIKKIVVDVDLMEKSEGTWEGKNFWDVRDNDSKNYYKWLKDPIKNKPPNGESILDLNKRIKRFYESIFKNHLGKNVIVVAHSGPIRLFILNALELSPRKFWYLRVDCGSITEIHLSKKHSLVQKVNQT